MAKAATKTRGAASAGCCGTVLAAGLSEADAGELARTFAALSDPVRLRLLSLVAASGEVCSCNLEGPLGKSQPTISHHTKALADAGLIVGEKRGRWMWWRIVPERLAEVREPRVTGGRRPAALVLFATAIVATGACRSSSAVNGATTTRSTRAPRVIETGCGATAGVTIPWTQLRNPILSYPDTAAKDVGVRVANGRWHFLFSSIGKPEHWSIGTASSSDLVHWSALSVWPDQTATRGLASPDVVQAPDGTYVVTYQSNPGDTGGAAKLYYRTSRDLAHWSHAKPLARALHPRPGDRMIDGALAYTGHGVILGYKYGLADGSQRQAFEIAWSRSGSLDGPWRLVGRPAISEFGDTFENYEFLRIDGVWRVVATTNTLDRPYFATLAGPPSNPQSWLDWTGGRVLDIPAERWNSAPGPSGLTHEVANAIYLCDARAVDGHYYVFYAGSAELTQFAGWGHAAIGVARSTDLVHWSVPG